MTTSLFEAHSHLIPYDPRQEIEDSILPVKPADEALKPNGMKVTKRLMLEDGIVQPGAFASSEIFSDKDQRDYRKHTVTAQNILDIMHEPDNLIPGARNGEVAFELLEMMVAASFDRAVMVEAARQYHEKNATGTLTANEAADLERMLNEAQDRIYPQVQPELAENTLRKLTGQEVMAEPILSIETRQAWYTFLHEKFDPLFEDIYDQYDDDEPIIDDKLRAMMVEFMKLSGLPMAEDEADVTKWKVIGGENETGFRIIPNEKKVICGTREKGLSKLGYEKMMVHEVMVHMWRAENGSRTGYSALQTGLPGYLETEEGIGILMESLWSGENPEALSRDHFRYAAVAFAEGAYDGIKHSEQDVHDFIRPLMERNGFGDNKDELFLNVMRVFRGMPANCRMHSNLSYLSGKIGAMKRIEEKFGSGHSVDEVFDEFLEGKYDILSESQANLMNKFKTTAQQGKTI